MHMLSKRVKMCLANFTSYVHSEIALLMLFIIVMSVVNILIFPNTANAFQLMHETWWGKSSGNLKLNPLPTLIVSPIATTISTPQGSSDQQVLTEAQNNVNIADTIIYWSQYLLAGVGLVFAAVGFLGIREFSHFVRLRKESEMRLKSVSDLEKRVESQLTVLTTRSTSESQRLNEQTTQLTNLYTEEKEKFEKRLEQFSERFVSESQNFMQNYMEASYNFNIATDAYRIGDNEKAVEYYLLALDAQPNYLYVMERLGRAYSNLDDINNALYYLQKALSIDPSNVSALRSLSLCYRYSDKDKAIDLFQQALKIKPSDYETWDFLGLLYRDNQQIDKAVFAHNQALEYKRRPETLFYLSILYALKGDEEGAKAMSLSARYDLRQKEHEKRIRPIWKNLICAGVPIIEGNEDEAYKLVETLSPYIKTDRTYEAVKGHLKFLLEATGHEAWKQKFISVLKVQ